MPIVYDDDKPAAEASRTIHYDDDVMKGVKARARDDKKPPKKDDGPTYPPLAMAEGAANMASGVLAKPLSEIAGLAATGKEMVSPTPGKRGDPQGFEREMRDRLTYQPRTEAGRNVAKYNPLALIAKLWGAGSGAAGRALGSQSPEPGPAAVGRGAEEVLNQLPQLVGGGKAGAIGDSLKGGARDVMQSALKPSAKALETGKAGKAVDTLLDEGINVSKGGAEKLRAMIDDKNSAISKLIENSPDVIDKKAVAGYLQETVNKFEKQVNPLDDVAAIQKAWDEFLVVHPDKIPVQKAQELKQGTYRALGDKSYGEMKGAAIEAQKTLARGLKEEIAKAVPQVRKLNAEESQQLNALSLVEKRALMEANKNPMGLSLLTTSPSKWAAFMADRSGLFKSLVARMLNTAAETAPKVLPPLGMGVTSRTGQLPPPPQPGASPGP